MYSRLALPIFVLVLAVGGVYAIAPKTHAPLPPQEVHTHQTIGVSVDGRALEAHHFGTGETQLVVVGGMHGGYEWNTSLLAYELINYFEATPGAIPAGIQLTIIPVANPDGLYAVAGTTTNLTAVTFSHDPLSRVHGRFNAHTVDLNRNFDCNWKPESSWGIRNVSAGTEVFSEPEAQALRLFVDQQQPDAFIFLHSKANAVYGSACNEGVLTRTHELLNTYGEASGYTPVAVFDTYPITGDAEGWLASIGIPAITVELATHQDTEFEKNIRGVAAAIALLETW